MATEDRELGPFTPASDMLILAAIERAICHGASDVWIVVVGEHLGFMEEYEAQRQGYRSNKVVLGRLTGDEPIPVELVADEARGLYGFQSPPGDASDSI